MTVEESRPAKSILNSMTASVGRFYEKRHQLDGALDQYSKALSSNPDDTATYINRSRVFLKMGSINKAQEDTDSALSLIGGIPQNPTLLSYYVCLQKAEVLYAAGEFELALMYFHRANKIKPGQAICLEGIRKTTEILQCTICNPNIHLTITSNLMHAQEKPINKGGLLNRPPIRKALPSAELPLTEYTDKDANRLLNEVAKDRKLLIDLFTDKQPSSGFTGLNKAKIEARQAISIVESQLKFLDKAECFYVEKDIARKDLKCTPGMDRTTLARIAEEELLYLQKLSPKEATVEILYRSMKIINCLHASEDNPLDLRSRLMLAEAYRLVGQSYTEIKLFDQSYENYKQAYEILAPLKDGNCLYRAIFDMSRNLMLANKYSEAIERFLEMFNKATTDNERAFVYEYISFCYLNLSKYDQAKKYAYEALDYASLSNEELLSIEANILLGKIYFKMKDFQRAKEYIQYAQNLKDRLGDLNQMKYLDEFLSDIQNHSEKISSTIQLEKEDLNRQWLSSAMQADEKNEEKPADQPIEETETATIYRWRILTPYHELFNICPEGKKEHRRKMENFKQAMPLLSTTKNVAENI